MKKCKNNEKIFNLQGFVLGFSAIVISYFANTNTSMKPFPYNRSIG